jgi:lipopolysaccharide transport system ATP-binding protein
MSSIQTLCTNAIVLQDGNVVQEAPVEQAVSFYLSTLKMFSKKPIADRQDRSGEGKIRLVDIEIASQGIQGSQALMTGRPARFSFQVSEARPSLMCTFTIYDQMGIPVSSFRSTMKGPEDMKIPGLNNLVICDIDHLLLLPGQYRMNVGLRLNNVLQDYIEGAAYFDVEQGLLQGRPVFSTNKYGSVVIPHRWLLPESISD